MVLNFLTYKFSFLISKSSPRIRKWSNDFWSIPTHNLKILHSRRNCYLENEKLLKFFKIYTKNNCENECMSAFMLSRCGCVEFFMIRNSSTRICSASERSCFKKVKEDFEKQKSSCECYEPCDFVKYDYEVYITGQAEYVSINNDLILIIIQ